MQRLRDGFWGWVVALIDAVLADRLMSKHGDQIDPVDLRDHL